MPKSRCSENPPLHSEQEPLNIAFEEVCRAAKWAGIMARRSQQPNLTADERHQRLKDALRCEQNYLQEHKRFLCCLDQFREACGREE